MSAVTQKSVEIPVEIRHSLALPSAPVTVRAAFRLSLDALLKLRRMRDTELAKRSGLSSATISKLRSGERFASDVVLDKIVTVLRVTPRDLFDPDAALSRIGLSRRDSDSRASQAHNPLAEVDTSALPSGLPLSEFGGDLMTHNDPELLAALVAFWDAMTPDGRLEVVAHARRVKQLGGSSTPVKAHGG